MKIVQISIIYYIIFICIMFEKKMKFLFIRNDNIIIVVYYLFKKKY